jgi:monoamine oxidase
MELGGEFIDSHHEDILFLVKHFGLRLLDGEGPSERELESAFLFGDRHVGEEELLAEFLPLLPRLRADADSLEDVIDYRNPRAGGIFDRMTLTEYLDRIGADGVIRKFIEVAYVTEFGLETDDQSALNLLLLIGMESDDRLEIFGESDERYRVDGGNQQIVDRLAADFQGAVELGHRLVAIEGDHGRGYRLVFETAGGAIREYPSELVLLTLPFSTLRDVEIRVPLPEVKRRAIQELGMGWSAKLILPTHSRPWRARGLSGEAFSDQDFQCAWDGSQLQRTESGAITIFAGGNNGLELGRGNSGDQVTRLAPGLDQALQGTLLPVLAGDPVRAHWPSNRWTKGGYACYKPGQYSAFSGAEAEPVGGLYFAGEHCSFEFQGYMNGAAKSARLAVEAMMLETGIGRLAGNK